MNFASLIPLFIINTTIIYSSIDLQWDYIEVLFAYWLETIIIGLWSIPKITIAYYTKKRSERDERDSLLETITETIDDSLQLLFYHLFFLTKYGVYVLVLGAFIFCMPSILDGMGSGGIDVSISISGDEEFKKIMNAIWSVLPAIIFGSLYSFFYEFLFKKHYKNSSVIWLFFEPYVRGAYLLALILFCLIASFAIGGAYKHEIFLICLYAIKISVDYLTTSFCVSSEDHAT